MTGAGHMLKVLSVMLWGVALAACTKVSGDTAGEDIPVEFCDIKVETKSDDQSAGFSVGDAIGVMAYHNPNGSVIMSNQSVSYDGTLWSYSPLAYWPQGEGASVDFYSYFPYSDGAGTTGVKLVPGMDSSSPAFDFTLNSAADVDLMVALKKGHTQADGPVPLQFRHILGKLQFKFAVSDQGGYSYIVNTIKVFDAPDKAHYSWVTDVLTVSGSSYLPVVESGDSASGYLVNTTTPALIEDFTMYLLPGQLGEMEVAVNNEGPKVLDLSELEIERGKVLTITLSIGLTGIKFTTSLSNWVDGGTSQGSIS